MSINELILISILKSYLEAWRERTGSSEETSTKSHSSGTTESLSNKTLHPIELVYIKIS